MKKIVSFNSIAGSNGNPGQTYHSTEKTGILDYTKTLTRKLRPLNVNVNAAFPGWIYTGLTGPKRKIGLSKRMGSAFLLVYRKKISMLLA